MEFRVAGSRFTLFPQIKHEITEGDLCDLIPEPENPHDSCAVVVTVKGHFVGYVPQALNLEDPIIEGKPFKVKRVDDFGLELTEI